MKTHTSTDDERWTAVVERDAGADGSFVLAVRTTKIYCRPSCPARTPHRHNTEFYPRPEDARTAGYRPCKRCHPDAEVTPQVALIRSACALIDDATTLLTTEALAASLGVSRSHLHRTFKELTGVTPRQYAAGRRTARLKALLAEGEPVATAQYLAGFGSSRGLYEAADDELGMTPATYRNGGAGMTMAYSIVDTPFGHVLVGATPKGIASVMLGDRPDDLAIQIRMEYPNAVIVRDESALAEATTAIVEHLAGSRPSLDLPLDVQATAFQRQVWDALRRIPRGATKTYGEVAEMIGQPTAARAVAAACAANPVALVTPCHRVVRADGSAGGYRWGEARKQALLAAEQA